MKTGDKVTWLKEQRGGYGYIVPIAAVVESIKGQWASVKVLNLRTAQVETKRAKASNLQIGRSNYVQGLDN